MTSGDADSGGQSEQFDPLLRYRGDTDAFTVPDDTPDPTGRGSAEDDEEDVTVYVCDAGHRTDDPSTFEADDGKEVPYCPKCLSTDLSTTTMSRDSEEPSDESVAQNGEQSWNDKTRWLRCPACGSIEVVLWANYDGAVKFKCADCEIETEYDYDRQWSKYEMNQYRESRDDDE